jgi:hypothetical protein
MTLGDLIARQRQALADEAIGVRRSWEETFRYPLKYYPESTPVERFDLDHLSEKLTTGGVNPAFVNGYVTRWRALLRTEKQP